MKSIAFPIIFHSTTRNSMLKLLKECKKYSCVIGTFFQNPVMELAAGTRDADY